MNERGDRGGKRLDGSAQTGTSKQVQAHIGSQLRQLFDEVVREPIPDRLQRLLADLDEKNNGEGHPKT